MPRLHAMKTFALAISETAVLLSAGMSANAEEAGPNAAIQAEVDRLKLKKDLLTLENEIDAERLKPLTDLSGDDKTELTTDAGQFEAQSIANTMIDDMAALIARTISGVASTKRFAVLTGEESFNIDAATLFDLEVDNVSATLCDSTVLKGARATEPKSNLPCPHLDKASDVQMFAAGAAPLALTAASVLLRSETKVSGIQVSVESRALASAVAKHLKNAEPACAKPGDAKHAAFRPAAIVTAKSSGSIPELNTVTALRKRAMQLKTCVERGNVEIGCHKPDPKKEKERVERIVAAIAMFEAFNDTLFKPRPDGSMRMADVLRAKQLLREGDSKELRILRVRASAGGSTVSRKNLWTALGAPGAKVSAGLIAEYELTDPATGEVEAWGTFSRASKLVTFADVSRTGNMLTHRRDEKCTEPPKCPAVPETCNETSKKECKSN